MPRGISELKRRNSSQNASRARSRAMQAAYTNEVTMEKMQKTGNALLVLGCVSVTETGFVVKMPTVGNFGGRVYEVETNGDGLQTCSCYQYQDQAVCQHIFAARRLAETILAEVQNDETNDDDQTDEYAEPSRGFVSVTRAKVQETIERINDQDYTCRVVKRETGKYDIESGSSGNYYAVELARGIFGVTAHCDCPDFTFKRLERDEICKHIASVDCFERQDRVIALKMAA